MTTMQKIELDAIDFHFEDEASQTGYHNGEKFTGIIFESRDGNYSEYTYKKGLPNGRSYVINESTNAIIEDGIFVNGRKEGKHDRFLSDKQITVEEYFQKNILQKQRVFDSQNTLLKYYSLKEHMDREFYPDGSLFFERIAPGEHHIEDGTISYILADQLLCNRFEYISKTNQYRFEFNDAVFLDHVKQLNAGYHWYPVKWFIDHLLKDNPSLAFEFLIKLLNQKDQYFIGEAAFYLGEIGKKDAIPYLKKIVSNTEVGAVQPRFPEVPYGALSITCKHMNTNGERAKDAISKIKKQHSFLRRLFNITE